MMPVMPMDPVSRAAAVAQAMMETAASQSMEPGPAGDAGFALPAEGAAEVMPVPPSTSMAATSVSMAPPTAQGASGGGLSAGVGASSSADEPVGVSGRGDAGTLQAAERERPSGLSADNTVASVQPGPWAGAVETGLRRRVQRQEQPRKQGTRKPVARPEDEEDTSTPTHDEVGPEGSPVSGGAQPRHPLDMAQLTPFLLRHAGGLAWTELQQGRRVIVLDIGDAQEGRLRGVLLSRDAQGRKAASPFRARTPEGWGLAWRQLARQHWRLHRDITPCGKPVLAGMRDQAIKPFRICLHASEPDPMQDDAAHLYMTIMLADPLRFQRHLGAQWTYLVLLHSLNHEPDSAL